MKRLKKIILVGVLFSITFFCFMAEKRKIVILDFQNLTSFNAYDFLGNHIQKYFYDNLSNPFDVVPKAQYSQLVSEITAISPNYLFDRNIGMQICRVLNLYAVIMGRYNCTLASTGDITKVSLELMLITDFGNKIETMRESADCTKETLLQTVNSISAKLAAALIRNMR